MKIVAFRAAYFAVKCYHFTFEEKVFAIFTATTTNCSLRAVALRRQDEGTYQVANNSSDFSWRSGSWTAITKK